jgi:hypothetical protein
MLDISESNPSRRQSAIALTILLAITAAIWMPRLRGPIDLRWDAGVYYILGTSIAEGQGYRLLNEPGHPTGIQYPPGLPALVAVTQVALGTTEPHEVGQALRFIFVILSLLYTAVVYFTARVWLSPRLSFFAALLIVTCVHTYFMAGLLFADVPFAVTALGFMLTMQPRSRWRLFAGPLAMASYALRTAGIVVLATWVIDAVIQRRYRQACVRILVALVPIVAWQWHVSVVQNGTEYLAPAYEYQRAPYQFYNVSYGENMRLLDPFQPELGPLTLQAAIERVTGNLAFSPYYFGQAITTSGSGWQTAWKEFTAGVLGQEAPVWIINLAVFLIGMAPTVGLWWMWRPNRRLWLVYLAGTWLIVALTPWPGQFSRYLLPVAPLLAVALVTAAATLVRSAVVWQRAIGMYASGAVLACVLMNVASLIAAFTPILDERIPRTRSGGSPWLFHSQDWRDLEEAARWLHQHAEPGSTVAAEPAHYVHLLTGLPTIMPPMVADPAEVQRLLDDAGVRYLLLGSQASPGFARRYVEPAVRAFPDQWRLLHRVDNTTEILERLSVAVEPVPQ